jgi:alpha-beta hydrolase superfamily lysophospholipase
MIHEPFPSEIVASPTGARLHLHYRAPEADERGVVQISHGLAEHAGRYARFAAFLAGRGFHVYAHDHRGHGQTTAPDASPRQFARENGIAKVIADVAAVHQLIAEQHAGLPVIAFGHSMGGLIALNYLMLHPRSVAGAAIWNADFTGGAGLGLARMLLGLERMVLGSDVPSRIMPRLTFRDWARKVENPRTPFDWLSHDRAEVDAYVADPNCGWDASVSMWRDILDFIRRGADDRALHRLPKNLPLNLVGGAEDPATGMGGAVEALAGRLRAAGLADVESRIYSGMRHESLNEVNRRIVMEDFGRWAERVAASAD